MEPGLLDAEVSALPLGLTACLLLALSPSILQPQEQLH